MNIIDKLVQRYCPNGIKYKCFSEVATIVRGASPRPINNYLTDDTNGVNWIKIGDVKPGTKYITETAERITPEGAKKSRLVKPGDFILSNSMSFGRPYILKISGCIHDGWLAISGFENVFETDFLFHLLNSNALQSEMRKRASFGGAVQNLNADIVRNLSLPVPPKEVQHEIVHFLDNFTELTTELTAKLATELKNRKKQYEYYRDQLLNNANTDVNRHKIGDVVSITRGVRVVRERLAKEGIYPVYQNSLTPLGYAEKPNRIGDTTFVIAAGAAGEVGYCKDAFWAADDCFCFDCPDTINSRFLFHALKNQQDLLFSKVRRSSVPRISRNDVESIKIPVPSIETQRRVVSILDNFDAICCDLNIELPAEIEAREKQYAYYRDLLLSFDSLQTVNVERERERERESRRTAQ